MSQQKSPNSLQKNYIFVHFVEIFKFEKSKVVEELGTI